MGERVLWSIAHWGDVTESFWTVTVYTCICELQRSSDTYTTNLAPANLLQLSEFPIYNQCMHVYNVCTYSSSKTGYACTVHALSIHVDAHSCVSCPVAPLGPAISCVAVVSFPSTPFSPLFCASWFFPASDSSSSSVLELTVLGNRRVPDIPNSSACWRQRISLLIHNAAKSINKNIKYVPCNTYLKPPASVEIDSSSAWPGACLSAVPTTKHGHSCIYVQAYTYNHMHTMLQSLM